MFMYYLVGENDIPTAIALRLNFSSYPNTCVPDDERTCSRVFLAWIKCVRGSDFQPVQQRDAHAGTWRGAASPSRSPCT